MVLNCARADEEPVGDVPVGRALPTRPSTSCSLALSVPTPRGPVSARVLRSERAPQGDRLNHGERSHLNRDGEEQKGHSVAGTCDRE